MTANFIFKVRAFLDILFKSYQSQCVCFFSQYSLDRYGKIILVKAQYYQPSRISAELSQISLVVWNKAFQDVKVASRFLSWNAKFQSEMTRIHSPAMDSYILAHFFSYMADSYNFNRICYQIENKIIYRLFKNALINYTEKDPLLSKDQVLGIEIGLHGRIPREAVRPRKTVQVKILGRRSKRLINKNTFLINRAERVNPELGTFSIWIRQVV